MIKLTNAFDFNPVWINTRHIVSVMGEKDGTTTVSVVGTWIAVKESPNEVLFAISESTRRQ